MTRLIGGSVILALTAAMTVGCQTLPAKRDPMPPRPQLVITPTEGGACMPNDSWTRLGEYILQLEGRAQ